MVFPTPASAGIRRPATGFTFIELMFVMATIAVLAAIAVPNFLEAQTRARVARARADLAVLHSAIETYRLETKAYPANTEAGQADPWSLKVLTTPAVYLTNLPSDAMTTRPRRGEHGPGPLTPVPYRYFNALQVSPEEGLRLDDPSKKAWLPGFLAGLLWGYGPATDPSSPQTGPVLTSISPQGVASVLFYDPTNGTTSAGDIYQRLP